MGAEICGVGGPREATSDCILRPGHDGEHRDASGGTWPYAEKPRCAPEPREDVTVTEVAEFLHERFAPDYVDHWNDLDADQRRETEAWDMANALASLIAERERAAAVEALREAADGIERELICCDVYERRDHAAKHHICYWGGAARALVLDRADRRAER